MLEKLLKRLADSWTKEKDRKKDWYPSPGSSHMSPHKGATDQISFRGDADQDEIISHSNLLSLWTLLWCWMDGPPACLAYTATHRKQGDTKHKRRLRKEDSQSNIMSCNTTNWNTRVGKPELSCSCYACNVICISFTGASQEQVWCTLQQLIVLTLFSRWKQCEESAGQDSVRHKQPHKSSSAVLLQKYNEVNSRFR